MRALAVLLATVCILWFIYAVFTFTPNARQAADSAAANATYQAAAQQELREAVTICVLRLGYTDDTIMTRERIAAHALCMHPTLKKHNLLTK